ncbi:hypothetical protein Thiosp_03680 [Thiorhodovibrio litoralis]|nr:hypothetical protein Thiosp_03680 [Thiorhodovibrio litoralis]
MPPPLACQPSFDDCRIKAFEPLLGIKATEYVLGVKPLEPFLGINPSEELLDLARAAQKLLRQTREGFAFHIFEGVCHGGFSENELFHQVAQMPAERAAWAILSKGLALARAAGKLWYSARHDQLAPSVRPDLG